MEIYPWGQTKSIKAIEIGKQDKPDKAFLIDTLLHEYFEAEIALKQYDDPFYKKLHHASEFARHEWIQTRINEFIKDLEAR